VLLVGGPGELATLEPLARRLKERLLVAIALVDSRQAQGNTSLADGYTLHTMSKSDKLLDELVSRADAIIAAPSVASLPQIEVATAPIATWGQTAIPGQATGFASPDDPALLTFCAQSLTPNP
jgi:hypothetical protein